MPTYAGVTFSVVMPDPTRRPDWTRQQTIARRLIPYANREDVQAVGFGNWRITVPATLTGASDLSTLQAAQGVTLRALTDLFGTTFGAVVMLVAVGDPSQLEYETRTLVDLTFERLGS